MDTDPKFSLRTVTTRIEQMSAHFFLQYRLLTSFQEQSIAHAAWKHGYRAHVTQASAAAAAAAAAEQLPPSFCRRSSSAKFHLHILRGIRKLHNILWVIKTMQILLLRGGSSTRVKTSTFRVEKKRQGFSFDVGPHSGFNRRTFESMNHYYLAPLARESLGDTFSFL